MFHLRSGLFVWESMCVVDACVASRTVLRTHLPAVCPHCAMGQVVFQNIRRAVLTEAVCFVAMLNEFASHGHGAVVADCGLFVVCSSVLASFMFLWSCCRLPFNVDMLWHHSFAVRVEHGIGRWTRPAGCVWCRMCPRYQRSAP